MDIIKIGDGSMKISLCASEAEKYSLNDQEADSEKMKNTFIRLLLKAREKINFKLSSDRIFAEIFSGKDGGCEIFISHVEVNDNMYKDRNIPPEVVKKARTVISVYSIDCLENLLSVVERLQAIRYEGTSSVYYNEESEGYYIMLEDVSSKELKFAFLNEYARYVKGSPCAYIKEHCKCICKRDAIKIFSSI